MQLIKKILDNHVLRQFVKYVIVGCVVTAIDMAVLHLCYRILHIPIKVSVIAGFMCGNVSSFIFNKYYTFRNFSKAVVRQYAKYFVTSMTGLLWTLFLMTLFYEKLNLFASMTSYNYLLCKMIVAVLVMFWNFTIIRHWTLTHYTLPPLLPVPEEKLKRDIQLSIIIPAYNEENRLPGTVKAVTDWMGRQNYSYEIIIVDDGSTDNTVSKIRELNKTSGHPLTLLSLSSNQGKGTAVREGMLHACGRFRLFMDADHQIDIRELEAFIPHFDEYRVIIGSKYARDINKTGARISAIRKFVSRLGNCIIRLLFNLKVRDTQCGFKVFPGSLAEHLFRLQKVSGFAFDVEIIALSALYKMQILELPITLKDTNESRVRTFTDSIKVFRDLLKIKLNIWKKNYKLKTGHLSKPTYTTEQVL